MPFQVQASLFPEIATETIVNVASVMHLSPFRYPGGKTWLVPRVRQWLRSLPKQPQTFIEPFCGGGIISLIVAAEGLADRVVMVELDADVAAVWRVCLSDEAEWLAQRNLDFELTPDSVRAVIEQENPTLEERAFITILRNRVNHGGILAPGSGVLKSGENGRGMLSRWYPETLARRIRAIVAFKDRIDFVQGDGIAVIEKNAHNENAVFFIDPPYTAGGKKAGSRLYTHFELDHDKLFSVTAKTAGDFLVTYDSANEIVELAARHRLEMKRLAMKNTHHAKVTELLIARNLIWLE